MIIETITEALKLIFPAYCANAIPVIMGGGKPLDFNKKFCDGRPIFGANKTFRGFFAGLFIGSFVGFLESQVFGYHIMFGFVTTLGALFGDLIKSFFKRRLGMPPGSSLPIADQLDFVVGALLLSLLISPPQITFNVALTVILITPPIHFLTNLTAYLLHLKKEPW